VWKDPRKRSVRSILGTGSHSCSFRGGAAACLAALLLFLALASAAGQAQPAAPNKTTESFAALSAKADAARDANRLDEALLLYKRALALRPGWAEGWWSLGTIAYDQNSYAEAARAFRKVITLVPGDGTAYVMLGLTEFELGHDDVALQQLEKGERLGQDKDPDLGRVAIYHHGVLLQRQGKFQAARDTLEQLCLQGVQSDELVGTLGMVLLRQRSKNPPAAGSPDAEVVTRVGRAGCLAGQKKFDEGRKELGAVVSQHPQYPWIHYAFGLFLVEASDLPSAVTEFKEEIANNPADVVSRLEIAAALYKTESAAGLPYAEEAVRLAPQEPFGHYLLGMLRLDTDDYRRAIPELEIARKAFPRETRIYFALGTAYSRAGRKQDAARARATFQRLNEEEKSKGGSGQEPGDVSAGKPPEKVPRPQ
jgi:tetratricopeptide (TPR) repeat protein